MVKKSYASFGSKKYLKLRNINDFLFVFEFTGLFLVFVQNIFFYFLILNLFLKKFDMLFFMLNKIYFILDLIYFF